MKTSSFVSSLRKAALAAALVAVAAAPAWAAKYASIVVDINSAKVLHEKEADEPRRPASLTKVMTLYMVFDALDNGTLKLNERMPVSRFASKQQPSKIGVKAGGTIKVEDGIRALVTKSANDVAVVFAERLGGSEAKFAAKMNAKAKALGMDHTTFRNASGLPNPNQVTTARDMARLAEAVYRDHKDRYNYFSLPSFTWNKRKYENHNTLLKKVQGVDGIKTGFTNASGYNLMASANRDNHRVIAVMLGGSTGRSRDQHVADLLEVAFLEISGAPADQIAEMRNRINFGESHELTDADALAMAQMNKLNGVQLASAETEETGSTDEDDDASETADDSAAAQGDDDGAPATQLAASSPEAKDPIGNLIQSTSKGDAIAGLIQDRAPAAALAAAAAPAAAPTPAVVTVQTPAPAAPAADVRPGTEAAAVPAAPIAHTPAAAAGQTVTAFSADPNFVSPSPAGR